MLSSRLFRSLRMALKPIRRSIVQYHGNEGAYASSGALQPQPTKMRFGVMRTLIMVFPFVCLGATISKEGAAYLEENDIFVPEDDD